mgnify:CR=1 FL=1
MPLQEFWNDDPDLLWTYRTLYIEKNKQEVEMQKEIINFQAWLQGFSLIPRDSCFIFFNPLFLPTSVNCFCNFESSVINCFILQRVCNTSLLLIQ